MNHYFEEMKYLDLKHREFCLEKWNQIDDEKQTPQCAALLYLLGLDPMTRDNLENIFDMDTISIFIDGLHHEWLSNETKKIVALAFNLFNGYHDVLDSSGLFTPNEIFSSTHLEYFIEALTIRFKN